MKVINEDKTFDLSIKKDFEEYSQILFKEFLDFKDKENKNISLLDSLMRFSFLKGIDYEIIGDLFSENEIIKELLQGENYEIDSIFESGDEW